MCIHNHKTITKENPLVTVQLFCEPEDEQIEGNASAIDEETDKATVAWIRAELAKGNDWAWCSAHVRVTYKGILIADDYLGCCSYEGEASFREPGGYFDHMVAGCLREINAQRARLCCEGNV